jgi:hypothetical protein
VWKVATGELIHSFRSGPNPTPADFSLDGSLLVVRQDRNRIRSDLIDTRNGTSKQFFDCSTGRIQYRARCEHPVNTLAFLANDRSFVVDGLGGHLSLWHTGTGQYLFEIANFGTSASSIQSFDSGFLAEVPVADRSIKRVLYEF